MMAKRKRDRIEIRTPSEKHKSTKPRSKRKFDNVPDGFWPIEAIQGEKHIKKNNIQYLIEWAAHPETGEQYPLEWVR